MFYFFKKKVKKFCQTNEILYFRFNNEKGVQHICGK